MPIMNKQQIMRRSRIRMVLNTIKSLGEVELRKLIGLLSTNYGFRTERTREYVRELRDAQFVKVEDGLITLTEEYKKQIGFVEHKIKEEIDEYDKKLQGAEENI